MLEANQAGKPIPQEQRRVKTSLALVQNIDRSIRTDWGGRDSIQAITQDLAKTGILVNEATAKEILYLVKSQVEAIRKRTSHDREELKRRFQETEDYFDL